MVDYSTFSALRLRALFPPAFLEAYRWYSEVRPQGKGFDTEYMGGLWDEELIDGVQFLFPKADGGKLGIVEAWAGAVVQATVVRDKADPATGTFVPAWTANVNRVLEALELPVRIGAGEAAVRALAAGPVHHSNFGDGTKRFLSFASRAPDLYHVQAVVHATDGLMKLDVRRPDLIRANELDLDGAYDRCFGCLFDEGVGPT